VHAFFRERTPTQLLATAAPHSSPWLPEGYMLAFGCLAVDADGAPYLRYHNHKIQREALVPIDEELQQLLAQQQRHVLARWPSGVPVLFPRPLANPNGQLPIGSGTYRGALYRWLDRCDIRDEHGRPVHLTPHRWRHTLGTPADQPRRAARGRPANPRS